MAGLDPEVVQFYKDNGYRVSDFYDAKRHHGLRLSRAQVSAGIVAYYEDIKDGVINPRQIEIGWGPIEYAKNARYDEYARDNEILRKYKPIIEDLNGKLYTWKLCFWCVLILAIFLGVAYLDSVNNLWGIFR